MDYEKNEGQCYIRIKGMNTNLLLSKFSGHLTLMGMTDASGEPVICICILAAPNLSITDVKGFDYYTSIPYYSSNTMKEKMGEGKALPGFPVFNFRGKSIPGLMRCLPKDQSALIS